MLTGGARWATGRAWPSWRAGPSGRRRSGSWRPGGRWAGRRGGITDRAADGSECRWARILAFDRPGRVIFSWDISPRWAIETDPAQTSEVEVRFYAESPGRTRVELEHRHIDRHGPGWEAVTGG